MISNQYRTIGIQNYYSNPEVQETYTNPHSTYIHSVLEDVMGQFNTDIKVLDLCSGNGLVTSILVDKNFKNIEGSDLYMSERYSTETGFKCYSYSFEDIANFNAELNYYDLIICSYAFDIVPESYRNKLLYALSTYGNELLLIRPNSHKLESRIWNLRYSNKFHKSQGTVYTKEKALN